MRLTLGHATECPDRTGIVGKDGDRSHPKACVVLRRCLCDFIDAMRKKQLPISPIAAAVRAEATCQQSDIAIRLRGKLRWDSNAELFINDEQANRLWSGPIRGSWSYAI